LLNWTNQGTEIKGTGITKGSQNPPQFKVGFDGRPGPNDLKGRDDAKVDTQGQDHGGAKPKLCYDRQGFEPLLCIVLCCAWVERQKSLCEKDTPQGTRERQTLVFFSLHPVQAYHRPRLDLLD
jgi:hypothetical protein